MSRETRFFIAVLSLLVTTFLFWWIYFKPPAQGLHPAIAQLNIVNAILNSLSATCLVCGLVAIKKGNKELHQRWMLTALGFSTLFLVSYLIYHHYHGDVKFLNPNPTIRFLYFSILVSHIFLSVVSLPLILSTFILAFQKKWTIHKKVAKVTFPIWLYVSVTGVLIVIMLRFL